jgi:pimeloyl-ACP methyl ester carboxylesterase
MPVSVFRRNALKLAAKLLVLFLPLLVSTLLPAACADQTVTVPVFVISDRKPILSLQDVLAGEDQVLGRQSLVICPVQVPFKIKAADHSALDVLDDVAGEAGGARFGKLKSRLVGKLSNEPPAQDDLLKPTLLGRQQFEKTLGDFLALSKAGQRRDIAIFVHGCCVSQLEALQDAARLSLTLDRPVIAFDWATLSTSQYASLPEYNVYRKSERSLEISQVNFNHLLESIGKLFPQARLTLVGHSMGNRLILEYLLQHRAPAERASIEAVHLVRSDSGLQAFLAQRESIIGGINRFYVYYAGNDNWLNLSNGLSSPSPRLGAPDKLSPLLTQDLQAAPNLHVVDISALKLGHGIPFKLIAEHEKDAAEVPAEPGDQAIKDGVFK